MADPAIDYTKLSVPERLQLVEDIWDSIARDAVPLPLGDADVAELDRRSAAHRNNPDSAIPADEVIKELYDRKS